MIERDPSLPRNPIVTLSKLLPMLSLLLAYGAPALAQESALNAVSVQDAWAKATPPGALQDMVDLRQLRSLVEMEVVAARKFSQ